MPDSGARSVRCCDAGHARPPRRAYTGAMRSPLLTRRSLVQGSLALAGAGLTLVSVCGLPLRPEPSARGGTNRHLIGVLGDSPSSRWEAFRAGLRELGWIEGQNLTVEYRWTEGKTERHRA